MTYSWTGAGLSNDTVANPTAAPNATTTYTCTATHIATGCQLSASITIAVNSGYSADAGADLTLCTTLGHQLTVQHNVSNATYSWTPAANLNSGSIQSPRFLLTPAAHIP